MKHFIIHGHRASSPERLACDDLSGDLVRATGIPAVVIEEEGSFAYDGHVYLVGSPETSDLVAELSRGQRIQVTKAKPGPQGGQVKYIEVGGGWQVMVLAGSDAKGAQTAVYDFARNDLQVDPFNYWTGYTAPRIENYELPRVDRVIPRPAVPILCYFDNDNDELANMTYPLLQFDMETWKNVIDSLVRVRYNAIDIHDHLGRSEFFLWDEYKRIRPDYYCDLGFIDQIIQYAHSKGVQVQIPMYLAWQFKHITEEESRSWTRFKHRWIETWEYYMKETPLGDCDIFLNRPRSQLWDHEYLSNDNEDTATVMTEAFTAMRDVILAHKPDATLICDLYAHGQAVFATGRFTPPKDYKMVWPDDGFGSFKNFPEDTKGYDFGTYVHAGFWLNHVVQDPYPDIIEESMRELIIDNKADAYCLVNGQTFRHFILNIEAYAEAAVDPAHFDAADFSLRWATRYCGEAAAPLVVRAFQILHHASSRGYVGLLHRIGKDLRILRRKEAREAPGKRHYIRDRVVSRLAKLQEALHLATKALALAGDKAGFCYDHVVLPITLFCQTMEFRLALQDALWARDRYEATGDPKECDRANGFIEDAKEIWKHHLETRAIGDTNPKWKTWYDPEKRRPNGGFPTLEELEEIHFVA